MTVRIEVPEGHKCCTKCGGVFPKDKGFYARTITPKKGEPYKYPEPRCIECKLAAKRVESARKPMTQQNLDEVGYEIAEAINTGEQVVYRAGGRIGWRRWTGAPPQNVEFLGRFNAGFDWRDLRGSLEA